MSEFGAGAHSVRGMRQARGEFGELYELTIPPPDSALSNVDLAPTSEGLYGLWNRNALVALVAGVAAALVGLVVPPLRFVYDYAWFAGLGVAFVVYAALMRGTALVDLSGVPPIETAPDSPPPLEVSA
jgi:hypothetical protein